MNEFDAWSIASMVFFVVFGSMVCIWNRNDKI